MMGLVKTLGINDTQHNSIECHYAECRNYLNVILSVVRYRGNLALLLWKKFFSILLPYNNGYTNSVVIYCHSTIITEVIWPYNTEGRYYHGCSYHGKMFYYMCAWSTDLVECLSPPTSLCKKASKVHKY